MEKRFELIKEVPKGTIGEVGNIAYWQDKLNLTPEFYPEYWQEVKPLFYCEDFPDGSFPEKSCNNCAKFTLVGYSKHPTCIDGEFTRTAPTNRLCNKLIHSWQGELKGHPIYEEDKCWWIGTVSNFNGTYGYWKGLKGIKEIGKYFSNKNNALTYFNELKWRDKLKFKVGDVIICPTAEEPRPSKVIGYDFYEEHYLSNNDGNGFHVYFGNQANWELYTEPKLEVGKWYECKERYLLFSYKDTNFFKGTGFSVAGKWRDAMAWGTQLSGIKPADVDKVKELLLTKAKTDYPEGTRVKLMGTNVGTISDIRNQVPKSSYVYSNNRIFINNLMLFFDGKWAEIIATPKSAEEQANELGFQVGDRIYDKRNKQYLGTIEKFHFERRTILRAKTEKFQPAVENANFTNKVAIHTPTKESYEFINSKVFNNYFELRDDDKISGSPCLKINSKSWDNFKDCDDYLILSVDEYMKSLGETPLFVTEDGINIYEGMKCSWYDTLRKSKNYDCTVSSDWYCSTPEYKYFSTKGALNNYLENSKPTFEVGKWYVHECGVLALYSDTEYKVGFDSNGVWYNDWTMPLCKLEKDDWTLASKELIEKRLMDYAKKNYPEGTKIKSINYNGNHTLTFKNVRYGGDYPMQVGFNAILCGATCDINEGMDCILYENGKWADILEEPVFKDNSGKFWYESDFKKGGYYKAKYGDDTFSLFNYKSVQGHGLRVKSAVFSEISFFSKEDRIFTATIKSIETPSKEEIEWIEKCECCNKYIPFEKAVKGRYILTNDKGEKMYSSDFEVGKVYWSNNEYHPKGVLTRFKSFRDNNKFMIGVHLNIGTRYFGNTGTNDACWDNFREATKEEESWLDSFETVEKFKSRYY